ncbi:MAG: putative CRISPR-associated protein [Nitrospirae bacterium]|nr:MAG: putative CRISPR-associated protein [Nitrospirota bacterium]
MRVLLNTVGTSILTIWRDQVPQFDEECRTRLVRALSALPASDRRLGAELTSIHSLLRQERLTLGDRLYFLVSETPEGQFVGSVLRDVSQQMGLPSEIAVIEKLQSDDPRAFLQGLRNLVKTIAACYQNHTDRGHTLAINATGGYKAQIAFAGLIGQVFRLPVFYQFEAFPQAVELPPLPVDFAMDQWLAYRCILEALESGNELVSVNDPRVKSLPDSLRVLLEPSQGYVVLNALGTLYHRGFWSRFASQASALVPQPSGLDPADKKIVYEDHNRGKHRGLEEWLTRVIRVPYVTRIQTFWYHPDYPGLSDFEPDPTAGDRVIAWYCEHGAATKSYVFLSENDPFKAKAAAADLARRIIGPR